MAYAQARMRIWNQTAYSAEEVRKAAIHILASFDVTREDYDQACRLL